jgi:hypothetical protein
MPVLANFLASQPLVKNGLPIKSEAAKLQHLFIYIKNLFPIFNEINNHEKVK